MLFGIGFWEWIVILSILLLLFGAGRVSKIAEELGKSFQAFKKGMKSDVKNSNVKKNSVKNRKSKSK